MRVSDGLIRGGDDDVNAFLEQVVNRLLGRAFGGDASSLGALAAPVAPVGRC
jgi:hypothetical protein